MSYFMLFPTKSWKSSEYLTQHISVWIGHISAAQQPRVKAGTGARVGVTPRLARVPLLSCPGAHVSWSLWLLGKGGDRALPE